MESMEQTTLALRPGKPWLKACLLGSMILVFGMMIGGAVAFRFMADRGPGMMDSPGHRHEMIMKRMRHDLKLTEEQAKRISVIVEQNDEKMEEIRAKVDPEVSRIQEQMHTEVSAVLTPKQRTNWDEHYREMRERTRPRPHGGASSHQDPAKQDTK